MFQCIGTLKTNIIKTNSFFNNFYYNQKRHYFKQWVFFDFLNSLLVDYEKEHVTKITADYLENILSLSPHYKQTNHKQDLTQKMFLIQNKHLNSNTTPLNEDIVKFILNFENKFINKNNIIEHFKYNLKQMKDNIDEPIHFYGNVCSLFFNYQKYFNTFPEENTKMVNIILQSFINNHQYLEKKQFSSSIKTNNIYDEIRKNNLAITLFWEK